MEKDRCTHVESTSRRKPAMPLANVAPVTLGPRSPGLALAQVVPRQQPDRRALALGPGLPADKSHGLIEKHRKL